MAEASVLGREMCRTVAEGQGVPGMSKAQVREALGGADPAKTWEDGKLIYEEWRVPGKERVILRFENNLLVAAEKG